MLGLLVPIGLAPPARGGGPRRRRAVWLMLVLLVPIGLATLAGLVVLWPSGGQTPAEVAAAAYVPAGTAYAEGRVVQLQPGCSASGVSAGCQAVLQITDGAGAGGFQQVELPPEVVASGVAVGEELVLSQDPGAEGGPSY